MTMTPSGATVGEWIEPSKKRLDAYLAEWIEGQRLSTATALVRVAAGFERGLVAACSDAL